MAYKSYRLRQKTSSGTYDTYHMESNTDLVLRFGEGGTTLGTLEDSLQSIESSVNGVDSKIDNKIASKADKVGTAVSGNFAGLDGNGNLTDSGKKAADFAAAGHNHDGTYATSGHTHSNYVPTSRTVNGKALSANISLTASDVGALASTAIQWSSTQPTNQAAGDLWFEQIS